MTEELQQWSRSASALVRWSTPVAPPSVRLLAFGHAGGSAAGFRGWIDLLPAGVDLLCVELAGRGTRRREAPCDDLDEVVDGILRDLPVDLPLVLFGHSIGAFLATAVHERLEATRKGVVRSIVVAAAAPPKVAWSLPDLSDDALRAFLRDVGGTPAVVFRQEALMSAAIEALRADLRLRASLAPSGTIEVPVLCLLGDADPLVPVEAGARWNEVAPDVTVSVTAGGHFFATEQPQWTVAAMEPFLR